MAIKERKEKKSKIHGNGKFNCEWRRRRRGKEEEGKEEVESEERSGR